MNALRTLLVLTLALTGCEHPNDVATLHDEAITVTKYYQPQLDELAKRMNTIFQRGRTLPSNAAGINEAGQLLGAARDKITELRGMASPGPDGKSAVEKQADTDAKEGKADSLEKLIDETREKLEVGTASIRDQLTTVEAWLDRTESQPGAAPTAPQPPAPAATEPAPVEAQPAQPKAEQPKTGHAKAEHAKAEQPKAEQPKAEQPKAAQPKAEQPKHKAEPAKAGSGAGSAAK